MKIVKEHINEKFSENSDPIKDLELGELFILQNKLEKINEFLKKNWSENFIIKNNGEKIYFKAFFMFDKSDIIKTYRIFRKYFNEIEFDKYLIFPGKVKIHHLLRNKYIKPAFFIWEIKPEYQELFNKIKNQYKGIQLDK